MSRSLQFDVIANDKASGTLKGVERSVERFGKSMGSSLSFIIARASLVVATVSKVAATLNELGKVSDDAARMGMSVEQYTKLKFAAEQYGSSIDEIAKAQKDVNKLMDEAATKGPESDQFKTLQALGFSDQDIINRNIKVAEVFERIGEAIKGASSEEEKFAIASRVFGDKISQSMIPALENYKDLKLVQASTVSMSEKSANALDRAGDKMTELFHFAKQLGGEMLGRAIVAMENPEPKLAVDPNAKDSEEMKKRRAALLAIGGSGKKTGDKAQTDVSSMAAIGGATFRGLSTTVAAKPVEEQQLAALETIAANTSPQTQVAPTPGTIDMTKANSDPLAGVVGRIYQSGAKNPNNLDRYKSMRPAR